MKQNKDWNNTQLGHSGASSPAGVIIPLPLSQVSNISVNRRLGSSDLHVQWIACELE